MKRPIIYMLLGYILGIISGLYCKISIAFLYLIIIPIYIILKILSKNQKKFKLISLKRYFRYIKLIFNLKTIIVVILFSLISNFIVIRQNKKYDNLYSNLNNKIYIIATVVSNVQEKSYNDSYKIKVETVNKNKKFNNTYLIANVRKKSKKLKYGDKIEIIGTFEEPETQRNYKGFDYKEYLKTIKVYGTIEVDNIKTISENNINLFSTILNNLLTNCKIKIENLIPGNKGNILIGIIFGDTNNINEDIKESFKTSNISHILAVSGMHISYIIISLTYVLKNIGKKTSKILISIFLFIYMVITNFSPSVVRSSLMAIIMLYSGVFYRKNDVWTSMSISILVLLIYNPFLIKSLSVQFSYGGTIGIILFQKNILSIINKLKTKNRKKKYRYIIDKIKEIISVTISAQIIIMPIMIINFNTIGIYFLITNLIVSLIIGPIIILGFIIIILSFISVKISKIILILLNPLLEILIIISKFISNLEFSKIYLKTPIFINIFIYYVLILILNFLYKIYHTKNKKLTNSQIRVKNLISLAKYKIKQKRKKVFTIIIIIFINLILINIFPHNLNIYFIDVGQGDSTLIVTPHKKTILIDGGGSVNSDFNVGENTLLPYLLDRRITKLDYVIISHFDQDHVRRNFIFIRKNKNK